jgi:hypothetical protein
VLGPRQLPPPVIGYEIIAFLSPFGMEIESKTRRSSCFKVCLRSMFLLSILQHSSLFCALDNILTA